MHKRERSGFSFYYLRDAQSEKMQLDAPITG